MRYRYVLAVLLLALACIALGGCIRGPAVSFDYAVSDPYDVSSGVIEMKVNATAKVMINNSGGGEMQFTVDGARLTANMEDGSSETVVGAGEGGTVPADGTYDLQLEFTGIPVKYVLKDGPPRFHPLVSSYDVNVTTTGRQKLFGLVWSPPQTSQRDMRIPMKDVPVGDYLKGIKDAFKTG